jgi:uncharacterized protein YqfB (UPF0267 family)
MILSFNPRFRAKILDGTKTQTIREDKKGRWKVGGLIHFATGVRTKAQETFKTATVLSITEVMIFNSPDCKAVMLTKEKDKWTDIEGEELRKLMYADGFDHEEEFWAWFDQPSFYGKIIAW